MAERAGHEAMTRLLLEHGAGDDWDPKLTGRRTPLSAAAGEGHESIVNLLLKNGGSRNYNSDSGP
jgi:ankyrin repeat protein